jgi:hypothetical protein
LLDYLYHNTPIEQKRGISLNPLLQHRLVQSSRRLFFGVVHPLRKERKGRKRKDRKARAGKRKGRGEKGQERGSVGKERDGTIRR